MLPKYADDTPFFSMPHSTHAVSFPAEHNMLHLDERTKTPCESPRPCQPQKHSWWATLIMAYGSLGVIYVSDSPTGHGIGVMGSVCQVFEQRHRRTRGPWHRAIDP